MIPQALSRGHGVRCVAAWFRALDKALGQAMSPCLGVGGDQEAVAVGGLAAQLHALGALGLDDVLMRLARVPAGCSVTTPPAVGRAVSHDGLQRCGGVTAR